MSEPTVVPAGGSPPPSGLPPATTAKPTLALASFEGPLDLLLHLIEKEDLDITTISLVEVTDQYLSILRAEETLDASALAEFVAIGSKLIYLKSRALLPRPESADEIEDDEVGRDLTAALLEYRRFKQIAALLREREERGWRAYPRQGAPPDLPMPPGLDEVTTEALLQIFRDALTRKPPETPTPIRVMERETVTVREKIELVRRELRRGRPVSFRAMIERCETRIEIVVQFLAVLELIKAHEIDVRQNGLFTDIEIVAADRTTEPATPHADEQEAIA